MFGLADTGFGVFDTVVGGPAAVPYAVGWSLLGVGTVWSLLVAQVQIMSSKRTDPVAVVVNSGVLAVALGAYAFICRAVWWGTQSIAHEIFPDSRLAGLGEVLKSVFSSQRKGTGSTILNVTQTIKDGMVDFAALMAWVTAVVSHWQIQNLQRGVYNVVFIFGPLLIGLAAFGLPTLRVWVMALFEVSSWSITAAALYYGLQTQFEKYSQESTTSSVLDPQFLEVMSNLAFLSMLMIVVPVVTGRLLGSATLGELARMNPEGNSFADRIASRIRQSASSTGDAPDPQSGVPGRQSSSKEHNSRRRPGD